MKRDSVLFYRSFADAIRALPKDDQLATLWAIINYGLDGKMAETGIAASLMIAFKPVIDKNNRKYANRINKTKHEQTRTKENKQEQKRTNSGDKGETINDKGEKRNDKRDIKDISSAEPTPYRDIIALYHQCCTTMPKVKAVSKTRQASIRNLYKQYGMDGFEDVFAKAGASDFLTGRTGRWHGCSFDWLIKPGNFIKVLEGNYDNRLSGRSIRPQERDYNMDSLELKLLATN